MVCAGGMRLALVASSGVSRDSTNAAPRGARRQVRALARGVSDSVAGARTSPRGVRVRCWAGCACGAVCGGGDAAGCAGLERGLFGLCVRNDVTDGCRAAGSGLERCLSSLSSLPHGMCLCWLRTRCDTRTCAFSMPTPCPCVHIVRVASSSVGFQTKRTDTHRSVLHHSSRNNNVCLHTVSTALTGTALCACHQYINISS